MREDKDELLNIEEACKLLNLSVPSIYSKVIKKKIPINKKDKRIYFFKLELMMN